MIVDVNLQIEDTRFDDEDRSTEQKSKYRCQRNE